ncbi:cell division initiation protein [Secundilactobacillus odoratitofui DSM 19909 = JCM 15043]|uniref:Cell division initiation protein n=1 Tax=Secundilactobacillus odoratitofui DSM 19909 = JCM 15043 TaxID=1423776 RepID=A0A0R1LZD2_9LACO|nr:DivIVA domain-containing protein [Secundilactobacillus odoratitofui]KRK98297.1 cell division initiation protein [Secundilactobacillus odoratitofui DSM 19909 = JCM 15043]
MVLSPLDIHNKEFSSKLRGYNVDEVNDFLEQIIKDYQITLDQNKTLTDQLAADEEKLKYFNDLKDSLNQSIIVAQEAADKVRANSQKEAEIINREAQKQANDTISEATKKANQLIQEASKRAQNLAVETDDLKKSTRVFRQRLQVMLESQLEEIKSDNWNNLLKDDGTSTYAEIQKAIEENKLDNENDDGVNSESQVTDEDQPAKEIYDADQPVDPDHDQTMETVVIFPDDEKK